MLVSEYRYVDNAATLGAKGLLADNRDMSRRRTPLIRLDDGAFFFEGMAERCDLAGISVSMMSADSGPAARWLYAGGAGLYRDFASATAEYDTEAAIRRITRAGSVDAFKPLEVDGYADMAAACDAEFGGARAPRALPDAHLGGSRYAMNILPWYASVKAASDALYDLRTFRVGSSSAGMRATYSVTPDPAAGGDTFGTAFFYEYYGKSGSTETRRGWGGGTSAAISVTKQLRGTKIPLSSAEYTACAVVMRASVRRSWYDAQSGESYSRTVDGYAVLRLEKSGNAFAGTMTLANLDRQLAYINDVMAARPALAGDGWYEDVAELQGIPYVVFGTFPAAYSAQRFGGA